MSFEQNVVFEPAAATGPTVQSRTAAQQHLFVAEQAAARIDCLTVGVRPREILTAETVGVGTVGSGIAISFLSFGFAVALTDRDRLVLRRRRTAVNDYFQARRINRRMSAEAANEAALIVEEGIAQRAADIDVVWALGYGWPAYRGRPIFWADVEGAVKGADGLETYRARLGDSFVLSWLLKDKAEHGRRFTE